MKRIANRATAGLLALLQVILPAQAYAGPVTIGQVPVDTATIVPPNIIFVVDDSGSMDWELMLDTSDGMAWWNGATKSFADASGNLLFNTTATAGGSNPAWSAYAYLFPNGCTSATDDRQSCDSNGNNTLAVPPLPEFAWTRSSAYNPIYYNPQITYLPWVPAYINGATRTFGDAAPTAARSHPWFPISGAAVTTDLTATQSSTTSNYTFTMLPGMTIPGASIAGIQGKKNTAAFAAVTTNYLIPANESWSVAIPYYPATYWVQDASCTSGAGCAAAPDGQKLRRYEIKSATASYPSGRSYADELQNFANWFTYYRKRKLMLAGAMGQVLSQLTSIRGGSVKLNGLSAITMYDFASPAASLNWQQVLGPIYTNGANGGTPTRNALAYVGGQLQTNKNIIQYACQRNATMVLTDGFADSSGGPAVGAYAKNTYTGTAPYTTTYANTLADIAAYYYTTNLRTDLLAGQVAYDPSDMSPNADRNRNLHLNTYAMTLKAIGTIYGTGSPSALNPFSSPPSWPNPTQNHNPTAVDDLWHAAINGRGMMLTANDAAQAVDSVQAAIVDVLIKAGSQSAVAVSRVNLKAGDSTAYVSSYQVNGWYGDLQAYAIDAATADINSSTPLWDAQALLDAKAPATRNIVTWDGASGPTEFQTGSLSAATRNMLNLTTSSDNPDVLAFLRGDRSKETKVYRNRTHVLGDLVYSEPEVVKTATSSYNDAGYAAFASSISTRQRAIYVGAGDGMLHAFNADTGNEMWAYIPSFVLPSLKNLASKSYSHMFYADGTPVSADVDLGNTAGGSGPSGWRTLLVGGLRAGGNGFYALDVTTPVAANEADVKTKILWEFPSNSTPNASASNVGLSFGKPVIAKIAGYGWVVMVSSGYNNTSGDGKGHLFVLNAKTGALIADVATSAGTSVSPSGLGQLSAFAANSQLDATTNAVYGGDLLGNVWKFKLDGDKSTWAALKLASLTDASNKPQPVTTAPELSNITTNAGIKRIVLVGTGQLLSSADIADTSVQSFYALVDDLSAAPLIATPRTALQQNAVTVSGTTRHISGTVDYKTRKGWYVDLPGVGERISTDPTGAFGAIIFTANQPSSQGCSSNSYLYSISMVTGAELPPAAGTTSLAGQLIGQALASRPVVVVTTSGKVRVLAHESNDTVVNIAPPVSASNPAKRTAWKEISR